MESRLSVGSVQKCYRRRIS